VHCETEAQAQNIKKSIEDRLRRCKLELHPEKTKIVYCRDDKRRGKKYVQEEFDFLGYTFRPRLVKSGRGTLFVGFNPAVSDKAKKAMLLEMRRSRIHIRSDLPIDELARQWNPVLRGWINYYGRFIKSALYPVLEHFNYTIVRWAMRKYKKLTGRRKRAKHWLGRLARREPALFAHWQLLGLRPGVG
jgi:RNA-directed DNA polymerase